MSELVIVELTKCTNSMEIVFLTYLIAYGNLTCCLWFYLFIYLFINQNNFENPEKL